MSSRLCRDDENSQGVPGRLLGSCKSYHIPSNNYGVQSSGPVKLPGLHGSLCRCYIDGGHLEHDAGVLWQKKIVGNTRGTHDACVACVSPNRHQNRNLDDACIESKCGDEMKLDNVAVSPLRSRMPFRSGHTKYVEMSSLDAGAVNNRCGSSDHTTDTLPF